MSSTPVGTPIKIHSTNIARTNAHRFAEARFASNTTKRQKSESPSMLPSYWDDNASIVENMERRARNIKSAVVIKSAKRTLKKTSPASTRTTNQLYFFSKSKDLAPGKGANEHLIKADDFEELARIPDWRQMLSNFHVCPFEFEGKTYNSIEHAFQGKKIALANPSEAERFTVDSGDEIGKGDGLMARKQRRLVKLSHEQLRQWERIKEDVMKRAAQAKYKTCASAMNVLRLTRDAELWHIQIRQKPIRFRHLEEIRDHHV